MTTPILLPPDDDVPCELCDVGPLTDPTVVLRSRRSVLQRLAVLGGTAIGAPALLPGIALASVPAPRRRTLVCIFLRGGLDGLATIAPLDDVDLAAARPSLLLDDMLDLDGRFGLHPALAPLVDLHADGRLGVVHAVGAVAPIRSHFAAQHHVETGGGSGPSGWLARVLEARRAADATPLAALAIGARLPQSLAGDTGALALTDVAATEGLVPPGVRDADATLRSLAGVAQPGSLAAAGVGALAAIAALEAAGVAAVPAGEGYPTSGLGQGLSQVGRLLRAEVPLEIASVDAGGFDLHAGLTDRQPALLDDLARSLRAFADDLGPRLDDVLVVAVSEFGRRVQQNGTGGTDHGRGGVAVLLGGGVIGGVHGTWPGLGADALDRPREGDPQGDLAVTTDVRDLLAEVVAGTAAPGDRALTEVLADVLPEHTVRPVGAVA